MKKLKIDELKVKSFITLDNETNNSKTIKGGVGDITYDPLNPIKDPFNPIGGSKLGYCPTAQTMCYFCPIDDYTPITGKC